MENNERLIFSVLKTIFDLHLVWPNEEVFKAWSKGRSVKNDKLSSKAREQGNARMKAGQWSKALAVYNEAVILANPESQTLALALANRAFVWMKLLHFEQAEADLQWLLQIDKYPQESLYKIYQRLGIVLQKLRRTRFDITIRVCLPPLLRAVRNS